MDFGFSVQSPGTPTKLPSSKKINNVHSKDWNALNYFGRVFRVLNPIPKNFVEATIQKQLVARVHKGHLL